MAGKKKKIEEHVKEGVDDTVRLLEKGAARTGEIIDRGAEKMGRIARGERGNRQYRSPPTAGERQAEGDERDGHVVDEVAETVARGGKRALNIADRGVRRLGEVAGRDPEVRHFFEKGADTVGKVIEKGAELARRGIVMGGELIEKEKAKRRRRS